MRLAIRTYVVEVKVPTTVDLLTPTLNSTRCGAMFTESEQHREHCTYRSNLYTEEDMIILHSFPFSLVSAR